MATLLMFGEALERTLGYALGHELQQEPRDSLEAEMWMSKGLCNGNSTMSRKLASAS